MLGCTLIAPQASAIVGGQAGGPLEASAVMVLDDRGGMCSGVVIAQDVVLTAAFCVPAGAPIRVLFREAGQPVLIASQRVALHPEYRANAVQERTRSIDMALIRLQRPLPARFEPALLSTETSPTAANVTAAGFGVAREGDASTIGSWRSVTLQAIEPHGPSPVLLWARGAAGAGICGGDGGGPITDTRNRVVAIANWSTGASGRSCGDLTQGPFLGPQRSWIDSILSGWGQRALWDSNDMNPQTTLGEPRPVRSIPVRPDGTIAPSPGSAHPADPDYTTCASARAQTNVTQFDAILSACSRFLARGTRELSDRRSVVFRERGWVHFIRTSFDRAIADFNEAIRLDPRNSQAFYDRGTIYSILEREDRAFSDFNEAIRLNPRFVQGFIGRGFTFNKKGERDRAIADFNEAIRLDPRNSQAFYGRGEVYREKGERDRAFGDYNEAIRLNSRNADAFTGRGVFYNETGDYDRAIADFSEAINIFSGLYFPAFKGRSLSFEYKGDFPNALADALRWRELDPNGAAPEVITRLQRKMLSAPVVQPAPRVPPASVQGSVARLGYNQAGEAIVRVSGALTRDALGQFQQAIGDEQRVVVVLEGPGGNLSTGIEIGNRIRLRGYRTAVAPGTVCASACAIAWLGGARRHLDPSSSVGFHAAYIDENGRQMESGVGNALVGSYANRLGLTDSAVIFITSAGPQEMNWIQTGSMNAYGVEFSTDAARYIALR